MNLYHGCEYFDVTDGKIIDMLDGKLTKKKKIMIIFGMYGVIAWHSVICWCGIYTSIGSLV